MAAVAGMWCVTMTVSPALCVGDEQLGMLHAQLLCREHLTVHIHWVVDMIAEMYDSMHLIEHL